jgi:hypothetical protein
MTRSPERSDQKLERLLNLAGKAARVAMELAKLYFLIRRQ